MKMETFLRLPPLSPLSPVIPGIVVDDDDVTNDERRVDDDVFIATLDSRVRSLSFLQIFFELRCLLCEKKNARPKNTQNCKKSVNASMHKR